MHIEIDAKRMQRKTNQLTKPTNFAELFEEKVQREIAEAEVNLQHQQEGEAHSDGKRKEKPKGVDENQIRRKNQRELHALMDEQIKKRQHRIKLAQSQRNTTRQWDLVAAAVEQANIEFHKLDGAEAKKMRGRSKVAFKQDDKSALEGAEKEAEHAEDITRLELLRSLAADHYLLGTSSTA